MSAAVDRVLASFKALVDSFTAKTNAAYLWRYSVEEVTETSFSGRRLSPLCPFDDVVQIPLAPGIAGAGVKPAVGSVALVAFLDGDESQPRCVGWDQAVPQNITIDASTKLRVGPSVPALGLELAGGGAAVHRVNDTGTAGSLTGAAAVLTLTDASGAVTTYAFAIEGAAITITQVGAGTIGTKATSGSSKVTCG